MSGSVRRRKDGPAGSLEKRGSLSGLIIDREDNRSEQGSGALLAASARRAARFISARPHRSGAESPRTKETLGRIKLAGSQRQRRLKRVA